MKKRNLPLHIKIIIGMVLGVLIGLLFSRLSWGSQWILSWIKPFGDIFINLLKLLAIPLIFASLVSGIAQLKDISKLSKIGFRTILWFLSTTVLAVSIGLLIVNVIKPGKFMSEETRSALIYNYKSEANSKIVEAQSQESSGPLQFLQDIIPENIFAAASENTNMLQVIFFAIFLGIAMIMISEEKSKPVREFFVSLNDIILEMINLVMRIAPLGVLDRKSVV